VNGKRSGVSGYSSRFSVYGFTVASNF